MSTTTNFDSSISTTSITTRTLATNKNTLDIAFLEKKTFLNLYISKHHSKPLEVVTVHLFKEMTPFTVGVKGSKSVDINTDNKYPHMCTFYAYDIYDHLQKIEKKTRPSTDYMEVV